MHIEELYEFCLNKKGVLESFPFDDDTLVFKVGSKIFALTSLKSWENKNSSINLKCDPDKALQLREIYADIEPGFHMNKKHWNTVHINQKITDIFVKELINDSYDLVYKSLTKKEREIIIL